MTDEPDEPILHTLIRPVVAGRYTTIDWDELRDLANEADEGAQDAGVVGANGAYAAGVRDALRWLADGTPTAKLLQLLGGR